MVSVIREPYVADILFLLAFICFVIDAVTRYANPKWVSASAAFFTVCGLALTSLGLLCM